MMHLFDRESHQSQKVKVGELLVKKKLISQKDLERSLANQKISGKKLGEILVENHFISQAELKRVLIHQRQQHVLSDCLFVLGTLIEALVVLPKLAINQVSIFREAALAETAVIPFGGTLSGRCFFDSITPGTLKRLSPSVLVSTSTATLICTTNGTLFVDNPRENPNNPNFTSMKTATISNPILGRAFSPNSANGSSSIKVPASSTPYTLEISITADYGSSGYKPGRYNFTMPLAAMPE